jgi:myo-inositol 2-dehydrogenase/D-chiro-inositol 1-dehydrogenase
MRFTLLGDDRAILPLLRTIANHPEHKVIQAALVGELQGELMPLLPGLRITSRWDELLAGEEFDAAMIAGRSADVLLAARQLGQSGTPLVVLPHVEQGAEFVYEMALVHDDRQVPLVPVFPLRFDPAVRQISEALQSGTAGTVLHIEMQRECLPADPGGATLSVSLADIDSWLLHDADLLRCLAARATGTAGDYNQVTAFHAGRTENGVATATVSLAGENLPEASWVLKPAAVDCWQIVLTTDRGRIVLGHAHGESSVRLEAGDIRLPTRAPSADSGERMLEHVSAGLSGHRGSPDWIDLTRAFEIVDGSHRSLRRRRTIDLHFETTSERNLFKTRMTALGCGLLTATLVGVILLLVLGAAIRGGRDEAELRRLLRDGWTIEKIAADPDRLPGLNIQELRQLKQRADRGDTIMRVARIVVFLPLFVFLAMQLLLFVARPSRVHGRTADQGAAS